MLDIKKGWIVSTMKNAMLQKKEIYDIKINSYIINVNHEFHEICQLHSLYWSIHTKDESKRGIAFAFIFGVN